MTAIVSGDRTRGRASNAYATGNGDLARRLTAHPADGELWQRLGSRRGPSTTGQRAFIGWNSYCRDPLTGRTRLVFADGPLAT